MMGKRDVGAIKMAGRTMFQKIWDDHVVADLGDNFFLLHIDRHIMHNLGPRVQVLGWFGHTKAARDRILRARLSHAME